MAEHGAVTSYAHISELVVELALLEASNFEEELGGQPKFTEEVEHLVME